MDHLTQGDALRGDTTDGPLSGLVVVDISRVLAGPYCTMFLADLGATVIKIESPAGDDTRQWKPPVVGDTSTYYASVNRNKHSIVLDFKKDEDLETAYSIVDRADVLVENFKPGGLKKFGLDASQTSERWPDLIHASITGFGSHGGASMPGYDLLAQALSGFMHVTGDAQGPPQRAGFALFDVFTGLHATVGILAALLEKQPGDSGQRIEVNLLSSALSALVNQTAAYSAGGYEPMRLGNEHPSLYPYGPLKAKDGEIVVCCGNDNQYQRFVIELGLAELAEDARFTTMELRNANRDELRPLLEGQLAEHTVDQWWESLSAAGICCAPILTIGGGVEYADKLGLNPVVRANEDEDEIGTIANPISFSKTPVSYRRTPPTLNADEDVVRAWLRETPATPNNSRENS